MSALFSIRMRAAQGCAHEAGGRHISGAESLLPESELKTAAAAMIERALVHSRGKADFLQLTIESIAPQAIRHAELLSIYEQSTDGVAAGRELALKALMRLGVTLPAAVRGMALLEALPDSMRGAMIVCAETGARLDDTIARGVRVSRIGSADPTALEQWLASYGLGGDHLREALLLASKVAAGDGIIAELCWSDDPEYTTGYVAGAAGYVRLPQLKEAGSGIGGRVFFVRPDADLAELRRYLETTAVLVDLPTAKGGWLQHDVLP